MIDWDLQFKNIPTTRMNMLNVFLFIMLSFCYGFIIKLWLTVGGIKRCRLRAIPYQAVKNLMQGTTLE